MCKPVVRLKKTACLLAAVILVLLTAFFAAGCGNLPESSDTAKKTDPVSEEELQLVEEKPESIKEEPADSVKESIREEASEESIPDSPEISAETPQEASQEPETVKTENEPSDEEDGPGGLLTAPMDPASPDDGLAFVTEDGEYSSKEQVAAYINEFGHLPGNYITKREAEELGWVSSRGNLWDVAPGKSIGGSRFGNYEKLLPEKKGRKYYECDIDFDGTYRGPKRIIYSNDGLVFYTEDHYKTFEQLY